jgi:hypothetical protein
MKLNSSIISSDNNIYGLAYVNYLLLILLSILTIGMIATVEDTKKRAYSKYLEQYRLKFSPAKEGEFE